MGNWRRRRSWPPGCWGETANAGALARPLPARQPRRAGVDRPVGVTRRYSRTAPGCRARPGTDRRPTLPGHPRHALARPAGDAIGPVGWLTVALASGGPCNTSAVRCGPRLPWQRDARPAGRRRGCSRDSTRRSAQHPGPPGTVGAWVPGARGAGRGVTRRYTPPVRPADPAPIATTRTRGQRPDPGRAPAIGGPWGASRGVTPRYRRPDRPGSSPRGR